MSDASRVALYVGAEGAGTFGTLASAATAFPFTGESLKQTTENERSAEIRSDRNVADIVRTATSAGGDINVEWKHEGLEPFMVGLFMDGAVRASATVAPGAAVFTNSTNTIDAKTGTVFSTAEPGDWIYCKGFDDAGNNGFHQIETRVDNEEVRVNAQSTIVDKTDAGTIVLLQRLKNGNTKNSISVVKEFTDHSPVQFNTYKGCRVGSFSFNVVPGAINSGSFSLTGLSEASSQSGDPTTLTSPAITTQITNSIDHIDLIREGLATTTLDVTELSLTAENGLRANPVVGSLVASDIGLGRFTLTGSFKAYFNTKEEHEKYLAWTATSLSFHIVDDAGNRTIFDIPRCRFTDSQVVAGGNDTDVMVEITFEAYMHSVYNYMFSYTSMDASLV